LYINSFNEIFQILFNQNLILILIVFLFSNNLKKLKN